MTRVYIACAHLSHDATDDGPRNLEALCQRRHMIDDAAEHRRRHWFNAYRRQAFCDLLANRARWIRQLAGHSAAAVAFLRRGFGAAAGAGSAAAVAALAGFRPSPIFFAMSLRAWLYAGATIG